MTLVSIVTPSYNQAPFLERTIRSVLEQDYSQIEYIVVDGGSSDGSREIIERYAPRLAYWSSEKDQGQGEALNKGFARAHGEIVAWLNSDDYYLPGAVSSAVRLFEQNPDVGLIYADMLAVDAQDRVTNHLRCRQLGLKDLLCFEIIGQPAVFMRRAAFEAAGGLDPAYHLLLDHHLWIKIACQSLILHVDETWAAARYHPAAKNRRLALEFGAEAFRLLAWALAEPDLGPVIRPLLRRGRASAQRLNARYQLDGGRPGAALAAWVRALMVHPPTALKRLNIPASALLEMIGLGGLRRLILKNRQKQFSR